MPHHDELTADIDPMTREPGVPDLCPACGEPRDRVNQDLCDACQAELEEREIADAFARREWFKLTDRQRAASIRAAMRLDGPTNFR